MRLIADLRVCAEQAAINDPALHATRNDLASHSHRLNQNGATPGFEMCCAMEPSTLGAGIPNQKHVSNQASEGVTLI